MEDIDDPTSRLPSEVLEKSFSQIVEMLLNIAFTSITTTNGDHNDAKNCQDEDDDAEICKQDDEDDNVCGFTDNDAETCEDEDDDDGFYEYAENCEDEEDGFYEYAEICEEDNNAVGFNRDTENYKDENKVEDGFYDNAEICKENDEDGNEVGLNCDTENYEDDNDGGGEGTEEVQYWEYERWEDDIYSWEISPDDEVGTLDEYLDKRISNCCNYYMILDKGNRHYFRKIPTTVLLVDY